MKLQLLKPLKLGAIECKNSIVLAPLTRCRASDNDNRNPTDLMVEYYTQRAEAGLIITEATSVHPTGVGYPATPGIWNEQQMLGWKKIVEAVHAKGGKIVLQLWHVGRISDPLYLKGESPVSSSAVRPQGHVSLIRPQKEFETPRELSHAEIKDMVQAYKIGAEYAKQAGFDGVEIHGANGYLPDQFLHKKSNLREDEYGGSFENRCRFHLEVTDAVASVFGYDRVGMHLAPCSDAHDVFSPASQDLKPEIKFGQVQGQGLQDEDDEKAFLYLVRELAKRQLAFLFTRETPTMNGETKDYTDQFQELFSGAIIRNQAIDFVMGEKLLNDKRASGISFGRAFIANPEIVSILAYCKSESDLINTYEQLKKAPVAVYYSPGAKGYTTSF